MQKHREHNGLFDSSPNFIFYPTPIKNVMRASTLPRAPASAPAHAISLPPVLPNLASVVGLPSEPPSLRCPPRPPSRPPVLGAPLHACCDLRLVVIPTLRAHSPAPANQPAMPPPTYVAEDFCWLRPRPLYPHSPFVSSSPPVAEWCLGSSSPCAHRFPRRPLSTHRHVATTPAENPCLSGDE